MEFLAFGGPLAFHAMVIDFILLLTNFISPTFQRVMFLLCLDHRCDNTQYQVVIFMQSW
jgi:hypothetical protein